MSGLFDVTAAAPQVLHYLHRQEGAEGQGDDGEAADAQDDEADGLEPAAGAVAGEGAPLHEQQQQAQGGMNLFGRVARPDLPFPLGLLDDLGFADRGFDGESAHGLEQLQLCTECAALLQLYVLPAI